MGEPALYEAMSTLRAVRRLRPDPVPEDVLERIILAATWAPSGGNRQPWRIVAVRDRANMARLGALYRSMWTPYAESARGGLGSAPDAIRERILRMIGAGDYLSAHFDETPVVLIFCFHPAHLAVTDAALDRVSVVGGGSIYPAVQNTLLACRAEGLGAVLTTLLCAHEDAVVEMLGIPSPWATAAAIPIGYPVGRGHGPISRKSPAEMAYADRWGEPFQIASGARD